MIGTTLSHYEITAELGRGGMGIVYKAEDTKLDRTVALKVLPASALSSEDDRARFYREAKAAAALNHPNIASIHQIDEAIAEDADGNQLEASDGPRPFIAMEYVEGGTLEERIKQGPMKIAAAVRIAIQIVDALKAAHAKEIVHRDIKSANIMLTKDGQAKVLDFGLAQTTASTKLTRMGSTLGTVAYMSPEQARGEEVDGRSDLYSLGTVLYEMVAGRMPFGGEYEQAVVYSILNADPEPLTAVRTGVPMELERIVAKAMAKLAEYRYQTAADMAADLKALDVGASGSTQSRATMTAVHATAPASTSAPASRPVWWVTVIALVCLIAGGLVTWAMLPGAAEPPVERLMLDMDGMRHINSVGISPDSRYIALTGFDWSGREGLFLYNVAEGSLSYIERTETASYPWFSPSGTRLAFSRGMDESAYVMDVPSGPARLVVENAFTSYWLDEDRILYTVNRPDSIGTGGGLEDIARGANFVYSISSSSSERIAGTERASEGSEWFFPGPRLPGTDLSIGNVQGAARFGLDPRLYILDAERLSITETDVAGINAQPLTKDILIYQLGDDAGKLVARRIDPETGAFRSPPVDFKEEAFFAHFQAEPNSGSFVFAEDRLPDQQNLVVLDVESRSLSSYAVYGGNAEVVAIALSADGAELITNSTNGDTGLTRVVTVDLDNERQVTRADGVSYLAMERVDSGRMLVRHYVIKNGLKTGGEQLHVLDVGSRQPADTVTARLHGLEFGGRVPGGYILGVDGEIGFMDRDGVTFTPFSSGNMIDVSPDGRFVAHVRQGGVMVVHDRTSGQSTELSALRGFRPTWSSDGRYLYYFSLDGLPANVSNEADVVRVPIRTDGGFRVTGPPEFIMHVLHPRLLAEGGGRIATLSAGDVSLNPPTRRSARVGWWRNVGSELDKTLPK